MSRRAPMPDSARGETPMPSSFDDDLEFWEEGRWSKLWRKLKEEPLVPLGLAATCWALYGAAKSIRRGDKTKTNQMFRARVYAQAFTLVCICAGSYYYKEDREKRKYYEGLLGEKKAKEKREAWIKELEARDAEDQEERERRRERRQALREEAQSRGAKGSVDEEGVKAAFDERDLREMIPGSRILGPALRIWWSKEE